MSIEQFFPGAVRQPADLIMDGLDPDEGTDMRNNGLFSQTKTGVHRMEKNGVIIIARRGEIDLTGSPKSEPRPTPEQFK